MQCATPRKGLWTWLTAPAAEMGQPPPANVPLGPGAAAAWSAWRDEAVSRARWGSGAPLLPSRNGRAAGRRRPRRAGAAGRGGGLSAALLAAGLLLLLASVGLLVYGPWREQQHLAARPAGPGETLPARRDAPAADGADRSVRMGTAKALGESAVWMDIPRIGVDAPVMEMQLDHGEYQVPSFDVGHHADSANPGQDGNSVYNGHLETIDAGHVFARLHELRPGDLVYVYTASYRFEWVVEDAHTVRNDDKSFLAPTAEPRLTLYTCAGTFDLRTHDYTHRLVVVARLAQVAARAHPAAQS